MDIEHAATLQWMVALFAYLEDVVPPAVESARDLCVAALNGEATVPNLRAAASHVARAQGRVPVDSAESDALRCCLLALKVALVLAGDRVERTDEIREEFSRSLAGCGVQVIVPMAWGEGEPQCFGW